MKHTLRVLALSLVATIAATAFAAHEYAFVLYAAADDAPVGEVEVGHTAGLVDIELLQGFAGPIRFAVRMGDQVQAYTGSVSAEGGLTIDGFEAGLGAFFAQFGEGLTIQVRTDDSIDGDVGDEDGREDDGMDDHGSGDDDGTPDQGSGDDDGTADQGSGDDEGMDDHGSGDDEDGDHDDDDDGDDHGGDDEHDDDGDEHDAGDDD